MTATGGGLELALEVGGRDPGSAPLRVGDELALRVRSPRSGYLHLFNAGTSGVVTRLFPSAAFAGVGNWVEGGEWHTAPGDLVPAALFPCGAWIENGPLTEDTGMRERFVAILTDDPLRLSPDCVTGDHIQSRGGFATVEEEVVSLASLPPGRWLMAEIAFAVAAAPTPLFP